MKIERTTPAGLGRTVLAAAIALGLSSPVYAADPEPTTRHAAAERATNSEVGRTDDSALDTSAQIKRADNSAQNAGDAAGDELSPLDQSHAEADVELTRSIRQSLVDDDSLGTNAQNVKVITVDGTVTLRGPVANAEEQARVETIAKGAAGPDRVLSELQVIKR